MQIEVESSKLLRESNEIDHSGISIAITLENNELARRIKEFDENIDQEKDDRKLNQNIARKLTEKEQVYRFFLFI